MFTSDPMKRVLGRAAITGLVVGIVAGLITIWLAGEVQALWFVLLIPACLVAAWATRRGMSEIECLPGPRK